MYSHAEPGYACPYCAFVAGQQKADIFFKNAMLTAFICPVWWPNNPGHALIIPNKHAENVYDIPAATLGRIAMLSKQVALAMRQTYGCDGITMRQHNEPAGGQKVFHYHMHVIPRFVGDQLFAHDAQLSPNTPQQRAPYAATLRQWFAKAP